jgi:septum formation protein
VETEPEAALCFVETTDVEFFELSDDEISWYLATGEPFDKAGAYGIQGAGRRLVKGIRGDFYNVIGLPTPRLMRELRALGRGDAR